MNWLDKFWKVSSASIENNVVEATNEVIFFLFKKGLLKVVMIESLGILIL